MNIKTSNSNLIKPFVDKISVPQSNSHKGQNGRVLVIGGSSLFHSASLWSAEVASHFVDIVHYSSTVENNQVFLSLKKKFRNGIIVSQKDLLDYTKEDDAVLVGPGMIRKETKNSKLQIPNYKLDELLNINNEGEYTYFLTKYLIDNFPDKKFVFDAGALQMMEKGWLLKLKEKSIITPHQNEFESLFGINISKLEIKDKETIVKETAKKYNCVILLKAIRDIISDGEKTYIIEGGNAGLTKGGTGDLLAGLVLGLNAKSDQLVSAVVSSYIIKKSAEQLFKSQMYWYNINNLIEVIPQVISKEFQKKI